MTGLQSGKEFKYKVGDASNDQWSQAFEFRTLDDGSFAFSVFGDMGYLGSVERPMEIKIGGLVGNWSADGTRRTLEKLTSKREIDFVWHVGDISYADDAFGHDILGFNYEEVYNGWMNWMQNVTSALPYMVAPGNHESECHSPNCVIDIFRGEGLRNFSAYNARWRMPSDVSGGRASMWYSFNVGPVHFISMNSETDFPGAEETKTGDSHIPWLKAGNFGEDGEYLRWLESDLKAAAADRAAGRRPWIFAGGHRPFTEVKGNGVMELFAKYGVDLYLAGHAHSYARSAPMVNGTVEAAAVISDTHYHNARGFVEVVAGGAGCEEMSFRAVDPKSAACDGQGGEALAAGVRVPSIQGEVCLIPVRDGPVGNFMTAPVVTSQAIATGVVRVVNASAVQYRLIGSETGAIIDEFWLTKSVPASAFV
jgi:hypothetical protein